MHVPIPVALIADICMARLAQYRFKSYKQIRHCNAFTPSNETEVGEENGLNPVTLVEHIFHSEVRIEYFDELKTWISAQSVSTGNSYRA